MNDNDRRIYPMGYRIGPADPEPNLWNWLKAFAVGCALWAGIFLVLRWVL